MRLEATVPDSRAQAVDKLADELGLSRSQVVDEAVAMFIQAVTAARGGRRLVSVSDASSTREAAQTHPEALRSYLITSFPLRAVGHVAGAGWSAGTAAASGRDIGGSPTSCSPPRVSVVLDEHAQPFGRVHLVAHEMQESPHAHSGQTLQHPVEPSLQLARSSVTAAGNSHAARRQRSRHQRRTPQLYATPVGGRHDART
jgi:predicted transcriptional regulator